MLPIPSCNGQISQIKNTLSLWSKLVPSLSLTPLVSTNQAIKFNTTTAAKFCAIASV